MKVAVLMHGAISNPSGRMNTYESAYKLKINSYVNYHATKRALQKHLIDTNPNCTFDFFLHCWNVNLERDLKALYNPNAALFEVNSDYESILLEKLKSCAVADKRYGHVSRCLSIKKATELLKNSRIKYDLVIFYRYDVLLLKDIDLNKYDLTKIWINKDSRLIPWIKKNPKIQYCGDVYFLMSYKNALNFGLNLYDKLSSKLKPNDHQYIIPYVKKYLKKEYAIDDIDLGKDIEIIRLLKSLNLPEHTLNEYGLSKEEVDSYHVDIHKWSLP